MQFGSVAALLAVAVAVAVSAQQDLPPMNLTPLDSGMPPASTDTAPPLDAPPPPLAPPSITDMPDVTSPDMPPPPSSSGSGSTGSPNRMNFGSGSADSSSSDGSTGIGAWSPTPTTSTGTWEIDWTWNVSQGSTSNATGDATPDWPDYDDDVPVEVTFPGLDGALAALTRRKYYFNKSRGFDLMVSNVSTGIKPGACPHAYCVHLVFESDYGAMTPFDAFVLDRYESASGQMGVLTGKWDGGGPLPLVLGRMSNETRQRMPGNWSDDVFNWNETRRTTWTLYPTTTTDRLDEIDVTLSFKQLYTLLPGYDNTDARSDGPFYSADPTDQVILRVTANAASPFAGASAMLPIVVSHNGSQLVDIDLTSTLLYDGAGVNGGNEIQLTFTLSRRMYGGRMPWFPAKPSRECEVCATTKRPPDVFRDCFDDQLQRQHLDFEDLLSFRTSQTYFDVEPIADACFKAITTGGWPNRTNTTAPTAMRVWNGTTWLNATNTTYPVGDRREILQQTDDALRCWSDTQCAFDGVGLKTDAQVIVLHHEPARTVLEFNLPRYSFSLQLMLDGRGENVTTPVMPSTLSASAIAMTVTQAFPDATTLALDVEVRKYDNSREIAAIIAMNTRLMELSNHTTQASSLSAASPGSDSGSDGGSDGDGGSMGGSAGAAPPLSPALPPLQVVPAEVYTVEIISHNITVVPRVLGVMCDDAQVVSHSINSTLQFQVAPLDLTKFEYMPPPDYVNLEWHDEPAWVTDVKSRVPPFDYQCGQCRAAYVACLFDLDCAFGVDTFLMNALKRDRLAPTIEAIPLFNDRSVMYQANVTDVLAQARLFFPARGYAKFISLISCWTKFECNLDDDDRLVYYKSKDVVRQADPTRFRVDHPRIDVVADIGETLTVFMDGHVFNYTLTAANASALQHFLQHDVLNNDSRGMGDLVVNFDETPLLSGALRFSVQLRFGGRDGLGIVTQHTLSSVTYTPANVLIQATRAEMIDETNISAWQALQWPRLEQWLDVFRFVPSSSFPSSPLNGTSALNGTTKPITPILSTPAASVCWECASLLQTCLMDANCAKAVATWLPTVLPSAASLDADLIYRAVWNSDILNGHAAAATTTPPPLEEAYRLRVLDFVACLATKGCPVGINSGRAATEPVIPTIVRMDTTRRVSIAKGARCTVTFSSGTEQRAFDIDDQSDDVLYKLLEIRSWTGWRIRFKQNVKDDVTTFTFTGPVGAFSGIAISANRNSTGAMDQTIAYKLWFEPSASWINPQLPHGNFDVPNLLGRPTDSLNWNFLLAWFGIATLKSNGTCVQCLPKLHACFGDPECWSSVQDTVLPILKQQIGSPLQLSTTYEPVNGQVFQSVDVGAVLYASIVSVPPLLATSFQTPRSWTLFTDIIACFAAMQCDVKTMDSALEPPATAHVPSVVKARGAWMDMMLYENTQLRVYFDGQHFDYTETVTSSTELFTTFIEGVFAGTDVSVASTGRYDTAHLYGYNVTFDASYFGRLPQLEIVEPGHVTRREIPYALLSPWTITIQSNNQLPQWDVLINLLFSPPLQPTSPSTSIFECPVAIAMRSACYASFDCQSALTFALPLLQSHLQTRSPDFNHDSRRYELDLTSLLVSQVFPAATHGVITTIMNLVGESVGCAELSLAPSMARFALRSTKLSFLRPPSGAVSLSIAGETFEHPDDTDPTVDRSVSFDNFVSDHVFAQSPGGGGVSEHREMGDGLIQYNFEFSRLYVVPPPHLSAVDPVTGASVVDSIDTPWKLVFQSPTFSLNNAFAPWLAWLGTNTQ